MRVNFGRTNNINGENVKTLAVFGATGKSGLLFIEKALEKGYAIKALVRHPEKLHLAHERLIKIKGDILAPEDVDKTIAETDAVINLSGHVKDSPPDLQSKSIQYIMDSMKKRNIKRLVQLSGAGVRDEDKDKPKLIDKLVVFVMKNLAGKQTRNILEDGVRLVERIRNSDLDWTVVRAPRLTQEPAKASFHVGYVGQFKGITLTRENLADFILQVYEKNSHIHDMPVVVN